MRTELKKEPEKDGRKQAWRLEERRGVRTKVEEMKRYQAEETGCKTREESRSNERKQDEMIIDKADKRSEGNMKPGEES